MELTLFLFHCPFYSNDDALNQLAQAADGVDDAPQEAINDSLKPHGRVWKVEENLDIDPAVNSKYKNPSHIAWTQLEQLTPLDDRGPMDYFLHLFPLQVVQSMLEQTNKEMVNRGYVGNVSKGELFRWMGVQLTMCIQPQRGGIDSYWKSPEDQETVYHGGNFSQRLKMSRKRYLKIRECLRFADPVGEHDVGEVSACINHFFNKISLTLAFSGSLESGSLLDRCLQRESQDIRSSGRPYGGR